MGSSKPQIVTEDPIALGTLYGVAATASFEVGSNDYTTIIIDVDAGVSTTAIKIKPQVPDLAGNWVDVYVAGSSGFVADEIVIPLADSTNNQRRAVRLDTRGISTMRLIQKTTGGSGTLQSVQAIRDGSSTPTPRSSS